MAELTWDPGHSWGLSSDLGHLASLGYGTAAHYSAHSGGGGANSLFASDGVGVSTAFFLRTGVLMK